MPGSTVGRVLEMDAERARAAARRRGERPKAGKQVGPGVDPDLAEVVIGEDGQASAGSAGSKASTDRPITRAEEPELYATLDGLVDEWHRADAAHARIALAWHSGWHPDTDGNMKFAETRKLPEMMQRLTGLDFLIVLNADFWGEFSAEQRDYILDRELAHVAPRVDDEGEQVRYEDGLRAWRVRRHDVEDFADVVERQGFQHPRLVEFARAVLRARETPLFGRQLEDVE